MFDKFKNWLNKLYEELTAVHEQPHAVAFSFALGVFLGVLPFTGVIAAIGVAYFFKLNKPAAILGSALTNGWLMLIVLGFALQTGAWSLGVSQVEIQAQWQDLVKGFTWQDLLSPVILKLIVPLALGFVILSLAFAVVGYFLALGIILWHRRSIPRA